MVTEAAEIDPLKQHLIACMECAQRADETQDYADVTRAAISEGNRDLK
jgi:hypothetical protein